MREIRVVADTSGFALLCLYSGLRKFAREHGYSLRYQARGSFRFERHWPGSLWLEVHADRDAEPVFLCIDMADAGSALSMERLERCHVYFKRSFEREQVTRLPAHLSEKVVPYGVFYEAMDSGDWTLPRRILCEIVARRSFGAPISASQVTWWGKLLVWSWFDPLARRLLGRRLVIEDRVVAQADRGLGNTVCFQTRLWSPEEVPRERDIRALNDGRAEIVRALRQGLGAAYLGGVMRSAYAEKYYGELITRHRDDREGYLDLLQHARVSVVTTGIHRSVPGKLGESLAAGRCIVTEPLAYELPEPLVEGVHYLAFRSPAECVTLCKRLLEDDDLAAGMQARNREYYTHHGALPVTMARIIERARDISRTRRLAAAG
jgi:hypothetical protein